MALIRQTQLGDALKSAIVLDLGDLRRQAEAIKAAARAEADQILAAAREERRVLVEHAADAGRAEGLARGLEEGRARGADEARSATVAEMQPRLEALRAAWEAALNEFAARRDEMLTQARGDILRLAAQAAELVTRRRVELDGGAALAQLEAALSLLVGRSRVVVRVHPDDKRLFQSALKELAGRFENAAHAAIATDDSLSPGSCIVGTPAGGEIDASIDTQLERIVEAILPLKPTRKKKGRRS